MKYSKTLKQRLQYYKKLFTQTMAETTVNGPKQAWSRKELNNEVIKTNG